MAPKGAWAELPMPSLFKFGSLSVKVCHMTTQEHVEFPPGVAPVVATVHRDLTTQPDVYRYAGHPADFAPSSEPEDLIA